MTTPITTWLATTTPDAPPSSAPLRLNEIDVPLTSALPSSSTDSPRSWNSLKKWSVIAVLIPIDLSVSFAASAFSPAAQDFTTDFSIPPIIGVLGFGLYVLGVALGPLTLAPLSEFFGRNPIYIASYGIFLLLLVGTALVTSLAGFLTLRIFSGIFASVTVSNLGGTIADLWSVRETGTPMSLFIWAATSGLPLGYFLFNFLAAERPWRDVFWALLGVCGGFWVLMVGVLLWVGETRHTIIARRLARVSRAQNENLARQERSTRSEKMAAGAKKLMQQALTRPFRFLFTEGIVVCAALYTGYLCAISFLLNDAFPVVFADKHGFGTIGTGLSFLGMIIGISIGPVTSILQERHFRRVTLKSGKDIPEARVWMGKLAAVALPASLFWFAWTTFASVHWSVPILASAVWGWSFYTLILMTYLYTEDSYGQFSASALAGIGFVRNVVGGTFPLFGTQMFRYDGFGGLDGLSTQLAATILASLAVVIIPIPFILERFGERLRHRSPWAESHMEKVEVANASGIVQSRQDSAVPERGPV